MSSIKKIGFLASGGGSNLQAVIDACASGRVAADVVCIISNNADSGALERARSSNINGYHLSKKIHQNSDHLDEEMVSVLRKNEVDLVVLAGYLKKIGPKLLEEYQNRVINIHPALLPKFGGKGMYGAHVHRAVLEARESESGATVHIANDEYDRGPILAQAKVPVQEGDTPDTLAARVLKAEHSLLVETIADIVNGKIQLPSLER